MGHVIQFHRHMLANNFILSAKSTITLYQNKLLVSSGTVANTCLLVQIRVRFLKYFINECSSTVLVQVTCILVHL
jgi:hypothetical protein